MRTCVGCRRRAEVHELVRVRAVDLALEIGRGPGRGAWLCAGSRDCFDRARRAGSFSRALRRPAGADALEALEARLFGRE